MSLDLCCESHRHRTRHHDARGRRRCALRRAQSRTPTNFLSHGWAVEEVDIVRPNLDADTVTHLCNADRDGSTQS